MNYMEAGFKLADDSIKESRFNSPICATVFFDIRLMNRKRSTGHLFLSCLDPNILILSHSLS